MKKLILILLLISNTVLAQNNNETFLKNGSVVGGLTEKVTDSLAVFSGKGKLFFKKSINSNCQKPFLESSFTKINHNITTDIVIENGSFFTPTTVASSTGVTVNNTTFVNDNKIIK